MMTTASMLRVCLVNHGTLTEVEDVWLPTNAFFWRSVTLIDSDRTSRPDALTGLSSIVADNHEKYDFIIALRTAVGGDFIDKHGGFNRIAFANIAQMLKPSGAFVMAPSRSLVRLWTAIGKCKVHTYVRDAIWRLNCGLAEATSSRRTAFITPFVNHFFRSADRATVTEKLSNDFVAETIIVIRKVQMQSNCAGDDI
jgi:hypothetical protein